MPGALTVDTVRDVVLSRWPGRFAREALDDTAPLGEDGLGLDSIELVEVVVACEDLSGTTATDELIKQEPLTIRAIVEHLGQA
jgi:acyl carrier protein